MITRPICFRCAQGFKAEMGHWHCKAFPDGVPDDIITARHDHRKPYEGDSGIQYEPKEVKP